MRLVHPTLPYLGDESLLLDELRLELERLQIDEPVLLRASEFDKLERVLVHGTDRAGYPGDRRWSPDPSIAHLDVILATTPEQNRVAEPGVSTSLRKLPLIDSPMILVYAASAFELLGANEYRFRAPGDKPAALRAVFPIAKQPMPDGWFRPNEGLAYRALVERALGPDSVGRIVEVGCWLGRSTSYVARLCLARAAELVCVDTWAGSTDEFDAAYREQLARIDVAGHFRQHLERLGVPVNCLRQPSITAADRFTLGSVDLVFLDASHDQAAVAADLAAWAPRVRPGGIMAGHDFSDRLPGVVAAVSSFARTHSREIQRGPGSLWWLVL